MSEGVISLDKWLAALRAELAAAHKSAHAAIAADASLPTFRLKDMELEVEIGTTYSGEGGGSVKLWVVLDASAKAKMERMTLHKVKFTLEMSDPQYTLGGTGHKPDAPSKIVSAPNVLKRDLKEATRQHSSRK
jgi:hypothetical protein